MFRLIPNPTFKAPVQLSVPGEKKPIEITVEFRHKNATALKAWSDQAPNRTDVDNLVDVIASWSGVMGPEGEQVEFSPTAVATLLENYPAAKWELLAAYKSELTEAKRKN
jgi:hypothetical protein